MAERSLQELENKIREALPHLKMLGKGAIIYRPHWNIFSQSFEEDVFDEYEYRYGNIYYEGEIVSTEPDKFIQEGFDIVSHPIMLNDVLLYLKFKDCSINDATNDCLAFSKGDKTVFWDLFTVSLSEQDDAVLKFLNEL